MRGHARLLALMRWDRERRLLWPWGGVVGEGYAPDPRLGGEVLRRFPPSRGWLLADAGFDGKEMGLRAMEKDFSWEGPARAYREVYREALG